MPKTKRIENILNARKSANSRSLRVKAEDLSLYNEYKESLNSSKIKINLRNNSMIEVNLMNYLTLECYDEYDSYVSTGIVYFGIDGVNTYSILGLIDIEELLDDQNLTINDVSDVSVYIYSRRGLYNLPFEIYGIDTFYLSTYISGSGEYIIPLLDIYNSDNDSTFFITPLSLFNDYDIIYDLDSNAEIDRTFYPVELLITHAPNKTTYNETEYFNPSGMVVKLKYSDNSLQEVNDYVCTPQGRLYIENNYISVHHSGFTAYQAVTVNETLTSLRIDEYPRTNYLVGESFDRTGLKLIGVYPNNIEREITDYLVSPNTPLNTSNTVVTFTKGTKSINLNISVRYLYDFLTKTYNNSYISLFENASFNPVTKTHIFSLNLLESNSNFLNIDIGLIYRSISTFAYDIIFNTISNNFKLSVDERIVKHDTLDHSYKHIDSNGDVHEFTSFDIGTGSIKRYYDSYNANIVLEVDTVNNIYNLKYDNYTKVFNSNGYLINIIDKYNKRIIYTYDNKNRLSQVYSETSTTNRYSFDYDGLGHLTSITQKVNNNQYKKIYFYYDSSYKLIKIEKKVKHSNTFISSNCLGLLYDSVTNKLSYILDKKNNSAYHYLYDNSNEIFKIEIGTTTNETTVSISNTTFNTFFNLKESKDTTGIIMRDSSSIEECLISSRFKLYSYEFDKNNEITSNFIVENGIYKTIESREGDIITIEGSTLDGINSSPTFNNSSQTISLSPFSNIPLSTINPLKTYYYNLSFYLKINYLDYQSTPSKARIRIQEGQNLYNTFYSRINEEALDIYQLVSISFKVSGNHIWNRNYLTFKLDILDYDNHILNSTISDVRLKRIDYSALYLSETNMGELLYKSGNVECTIFDDLDNPDHTALLTYSLKDFRITEYDIFRYYEKRGIIDNSLTPFDFVFDNSKKRIANVKNILLSIDNTRINIASNLLSLLPPFRLDTYNLYSLKRNYLEYTYQNTNYFKKTTEEVDYIFKNSNNNDYIKRISKEYEYDSYDRVKQIEEFEKNIDNNTTTTLRYNKTVYTYNTDNDLDEINTYINSVYGTLTTSRIKYYYDQYRNTTEKRIYKGKITPPISLIETERAEYSFDSYNNKTSETYYAYNDVSGVTPVKKCEFTYDDTYEYVKQIIFKVKDDIGDGYTEVGRSNKTLDLDINESNTDLSETDNTYIKYYFKDNYKTNLNQVFLSNSPSSSNILGSTLLYEGKIDEDGSNIKNTSTFYKNINDNELYKRRSIYDKYSRLISVMDSYNNESFTENVSFTYDSLRGIKGSLSEINDYYTELDTTITEKSISRSDNFNVEIESNIFNYSLDSINVSSINYNDLNGNNIQSNYIINNTNQFLFSKKSFFDNTNRKTCEIGLIDVSYNYNYKNEITGISYKRHNENTSFFTANYTYDIYGNILSETRNIKYSEYINVERLDEYEYDKVGRITKDKSEILGTDEDSFEYDSSGKRVSTLSDIITRLNNGRISSIHGLDLTYDDYGNITQIEYADGNTIYTSSFEYERGNLLSKYDDNINNSHLKFDYDYNGVRYQKRILNGSGQVVKTITYYYHNNKLLFERIHNTSDGSSTTNDIIISYIYDDTGISGAIYKNQKYKYIKNILGDIILIVNESLDVICEYRYTAYGTYSLNNLSANIIDSEFVNYNPFTYRGYYQDHESRLYYLINRYYSPDIEMFITPDSFNYLDPSTLYGLDLYTYCMFNPIMYVDPEGNIPEWWQWALSGVQIVGGVLLCFIPGFQGIGVSLIASGTTSMISNIITTCGIDGKTASLISSGLNITTGIILSLAGFGGLGASYIGSGIGGILGGYVAEYIGVKFETGAFIGNIIGSFAGIKLYEFSRFSKIAKTGIVIGKSDNFVKYSNATGLDRYCGLRGYKKIESVFPNLASKLGWAHNYDYISNVMRYGGIIYNLGGDISGCYQKELELLLDYILLINLEYF